jgi:putative ATP-binding cassette transporter
LLLINLINGGIRHVARAVENPVVQRQSLPFWRIVLHGFCLLLARLWRRWLSVRMLLDSRADRSCSRHDSGWETAVPSIDNPDQRIVQDRSRFTGTSLSVIVDVLAALLSFASCIWRRISAMASCTSARPGVCERGRLATPPTTPG